VTDIDAPPGERFDLPGARAAAARGETAVWVGAFLASRGSDNEILAAALAQERHWWYGPLRLPLDELIRLAGPEDDALVPIDEAEWEADVESMEESVEAGWEPPPLLAEHQEGRVLLQDGNHRYEALARDGAPDAWVLVYFGTEDERDAFARSHPC
jgi:hypothetical protein